MTKKERSIKELLEIMLDNIDSLSGYLDGRFYEGLCGLSLFIRNLNKITSKEAEIIRSYIADNSPWKTIITNKITYYGL